MSEHYEVGIRPRFAHSNPQVLVHRITIPAVCYYLQRQRFGLLTQDFDAISAI